MESFPIHGANPYHKLYGSTVRPEQLLNMNKCRTENLTQGTLTAIKNTFMLECHTLYHVKLSHSTNNIVSF